MSLTRIVEPHSIAVVGASNNPNKRGHQIIASLQNSGYKYQVYPINPKGGMILGIPVLTSLSDMPDGVDLVVISLPAQLVEQVISDCANKGVGGFVILANGFGESGFEGKELQQKVKNILEQTGLRAVGPNTSGMINFSIGADLVGLKQKTRVGPISAITQSGNMLLSLLSDIERYGMPGLDVYIGLGNQVDLSYAELLNVLKDRSQTKAIAIHCEGFSNGRALLESAAITSRQKPIVLLRGGRSEAGRKNALSHTGSVAGSDLVSANVLRQSGITLVDRLDELGLVAGTLANTPLPRGDKGVVVLTDGGGHATVAVDNLMHHKLRLASLSNTTKDKLRLLLGQKASVNNPVDTASDGDASPHLFAKCIEVLAQDDAVGLILIVGLLGGYYLRFSGYECKNESQACAKIGEISKNTKLPIIVHSCYESMHAKPLQSFRQSDITVVDSIEHAGRCVQALYERAYWLSSESSRAQFKHLRKDTDYQITKSAATVLEPQARALLEKYGVNIGKWGFATSAQDALKLVQEFAMPCAFKAVVPGLVHKSDHGGVILDVDVNTANSAYQQIESNINKTLNDQDLTGVIVSPMVPSGTELFTAILNDPTYGPLLAFGSGGVAINAFNDMSFRALPVSRLEIEEMIANTRVSRVLFGYRNMPAIKKSDLVETLYGIANAAMRLIEEHQLSELEFNPITLNASGLTVVDVRMVCQT